MSARSWKLNFELLHIIHKGFSFGLSGAASRCCVFVFEMGFILPWCRHFWEFLSNEVIHSLSAWKSLVFGSIIFSKGGFVVSSRSRGDLASMEISFSELWAYFATRIGNRCEISSRCRHVVVGSWCFLSLSQVLPAGWANKSSMF